MRRTNIYITDSQQRRVKAIAKQRGVRSSELIRRALDEWLERYDVKKSK